MVDSTATCDWGRAWPSRSRTQGAVLGGAKGKPEDAEMRRARHVIQACVVVESTHLGGAAPHPVHGAARPSPLAALLAMFLDLATQVLGEFVNRVRHLRRRLVRPQGHALEPQGGLGHLAVG